MTKMFRFFYCQVEYGFTGISHSQFTSYPDLVSYLYKIFIILDTR